MKIILLSLILLCSAITSVAQTANTQKTPNSNLAKPKAPEHLYLKVHFTPLIVIGTLAEWDFDTENNKINAKISLKTILKGDTQNKKMLDVNFKWGYELKRLPVGETPKPSYEKGKTYVFFLYQNNDKIWEIGNFYLNINAKNTLILKQNKKTKTVTIDDFQKGVILFDKKYEYFKTKQAENKKFNLDNPTNNETFDFLSHDMLGDLIE